MQKSSTEFYSFRELTDDAVFLRSHNLTVPSDEALSTVYLSLKN